MSVRYIPFRPSLHGPFARRFYDRVRPLAEHRSADAEIASVIRKEVDWALNESKVNPAQRKIYRATWLLFRDLRRVGWKFRWQNGTVEIAPPERSSEKAKIREYMSGPRLERIAEARDFIKRMESATPG